MKPKAWVSWSSGKDAAWALHVARASSELDVVGLLTKAQRRKYDAGQAIVEEYDRKVGEAMKAYLRARRAAAGDKEKIAAARQDYDEKKRPLMTERDRRLDEEVGTRPEKAKAKRPARKG